MLTRVLTSGLPERVRRCRLRKHARDCQQRHICPPHAQGNQWQAVRLPYRGGELSMVVLLPRNNANPDHLLAAAVLTAADRGFAPRPVELFLPKWNLETTADLKQSCGPWGWDRPLAPAASPR